MQQTERILTQRDIEQELDVVQQDDVACGLGDDSPEKKWNPDATLPLGQVEQTTGELETDIDELRVDSFGDIPQRSGFPRALRTHDENEPMVEALRVSDLLDHCLGEMPRHVSSLVGMRAICTAVFQPTIDGLLSEPPVPPDLLARNPAFLRQLVERRPRNPQVDHRRVVVGARAHDPTCPPPELGQHSEEILLEAGVSWEEIARLRESDAL